jgi:hypothetical protein
MVNEDGIDYSGLLKTNKDYIRSDNSISSTPSRDLDFCFKVVLKEAVKEDKLVKQVCYTMLSAYTNNPINLAINAPSGEGKTHVLTMVGNMFPKTDVIFIAGMSSKAIFHKNGYIAIRDDEEDGKYIRIENELEKLKETIQFKKSELIKIKRNDDSPNSETSADLENEVDKLKQRVKEIEKNVVKVIDLSHKILVFLDTPSPEIFEALMSLLSHDNYEVEYQFVDTSNKSGLKTRTNVLVGWPSVIFAQAIDYTRHPRYQEIQRRFIVTNPRMDSEKYQGAVDLIIEKNCNPDFVYQRKIVKDEEKDMAKEIILNIKDDLLSFSFTTPLGKNNIHSPFVHLIKQLIPKNNTANDMTFTSRLLQHTRLLANIHYKRRPYMEIVPAFSSNSPLRIPMATYSDLFESLSLMNNNVGGIRPYVLDWYHNVFLELYGSKTCPNSKIKNGETITESTIAVTTNELIEKTTSVMKKRYTTKQILTEFIYPLFNLGYIDSVQSELDKRAYVYFPVIGSDNRESCNKNSNLFFKYKKNNLFEYNEKNNVNIITIYERNQIIYEIEEIMKYYSEDNNLVSLRFAELDAITESEDDIDEDEDKTVAEIVDKYYSEFSFQYRSDDKNDTLRQQLLNLPSSEEYPQLVQNSNNLQCIQEKNIKNLDKISTVSNNIFYNEEKNKIIYSCYYCKFDITLKSVYEGHIVQRHPGRHAYPDMTYIKKYGLIPQGKPWEKEEGHV